MILPTLGVTLVDAVLGLLTRREPEDLPDLRH